MTGRLTLPTACSRLLVVPVRAIKMEASPSPRSSGAPTITSLFMPKNRLHTSCDKALMPNPAGTQNSAVMRSTIWMLFWVRRRLPLAKLSATAGSALTAIPVVNAGTRLAITTALPL